MGKNWGWKLALILIVLGVLWAPAGCRQTDAPEPGHTTTVGPQPTGKATASIIPKDTTVKVPADQADADKLMAKAGAVAICGDGGVSFKHGGGACVGHDDIAELIRK